MAFNLRNSVAPYFTYHNDNNISPSHCSEKAEILYGSDKVIDTALQFTSSARNKIDACVDHTRPSLIVEIKRLKRAFQDAKRRGVKLRYVTEITPENVSFCKELLTSVVNELRHLDGIKGNFYLNEKEYIAPAALHKKDKPSSQIIQCNMKEIVEEQQYVFDTLWNKSIPAEDKIKEIEQGIEPEYFRVINDNEEATNILIDLIKNAQKEILFLLPNDKALTRLDRLGMLDCLIDKYNKGINGREKVGEGEEKREEYEFQAKIICPLSDSNMNIVNRILQNTSPSNNIRIVNGNNSSFGIIIVDNNRFLKAELREPEAEQFSEAIGLSFYSNSNPSVESYKLFFELLWNERTANEQFKLSDIMQREFINIAAHELRTPAQSVLGYAELMRENALDKQAMIGESIEEIEAIYRNAIRLQKLTNDILDVTRIESQTLRLDKEVTNLNELIARIVQDYKSYLRRHSNSINNKESPVQLFSYIGDCELIVEADRGRINQAISNLINNAIKFTSRRGGIISVTTEKRNNKGENQEVIIAVKDTGEGIHPEIMPRLFTKFATRSSSGTGLGLYISKSIVEAHGGRIWAENNSDGMGATFSFSLPMTQ